MCVSSLCYDTKSVMDTSMHIYTKFCAFLVIFVYVLVADKMSFDRLYFFSVPTFVPILLRLKPLITLAFDLQFRTTGCLTKSRHVQVPKKVRLYIVFCSSTGQERLYDDKSSSLTVGLS